MLVNYLASAILIALGLYAILTKKNLIKVVIGMGIVDLGINLLLISFGYNNGGTAPIFSWTEIVSGMHFVDPVPQALTLTSIVIGACVDAMALALCIMIYRKYGTINTEEVRRIRG